MIYTYKVSKIRKHFYIDTFFLKSLTIPSIPLKEWVCFYYSILLLFLIHLFEKMINLLIPTETINIGTTITRGGLYLLISKAHRKTTLFAISFACACLKRYETLCISIYKEFHTFQTCPCIRHDNTCTDACIITLWRHCYTYMYRSSRSNQLMALSNKYGNN